MNVDKIAKSIEKDAGQHIESLHAGLEEMKAHKSANIYSPEQLLVRAVRNQLGMTQAVFSSLINTPVGTLRDWEYGRFKPSGAVLCLLKVLQKHPELVSEIAA